MASPEFDSPDEMLLAHIRSMPESTLHQRLVIPLLKAMGATGIQYLHGPGERGKDIAYILKDLYGDSRFEVCQVKNDKLSGRAGSSANTVTVLQQILTCRKCEARNPETGCMELPQAVSLWSTYALTNTADCQHLLEELRALQCKILGPDRIVGLISRFLPEMYDEFAFPGTGIARAMQLYLKTHHEAAAFEITNTRPLTEFYVDLGVGSPPAFGFENTASKGAQAAGRDPLEIDRKLYEELQDMVSLGFPRSVAARPPITVSANELKQKLSHRRLSVKRFDVPGFISRATAYMQKLCASPDPTNLSRALRIMTWTAQAAERALSSIKGLLLSAEEQEALNES